MMTFEELGVSKALTAVLNKRNITAPTPIQQRAYQPVTKGTDVIGCSAQVRERHWLIYCL